MTLSSVFRYTTTILPALLLGLFILLAPETTHAISWNPLNWLSDAASGAASYIFSGLANILGKALYLLATIFGGAVLYFGSLVLDMTVYYLVIQMGNFFTGNSWFGQAVTLGWTLIRDLINMTFIFGLIYIGIKTILNSESADTRRQLIYLIFAALLINFSLFFTQLLVDFSNLLAAQMYTQLTQGQQTTGVPSFTAAFMTASGISGFLTTGSIQQSNATEPSIEGGALIVYSVLLFLFYVLAGISFLMGAIMIVTRFIALTLYMIFSPVMFLGWILPQFKSYASTWWEGFWKYCIFAPIYLFLLFIALRVLTGLTSSGSPLAPTTGGTSLEVIAQASAQARTTTGQIIIGFMIMIGLLWASLKIGDKLSISGSKMAMGVAGAVTAPLRGLQGAVYRNTVGRGLNRLSEKYDSLDRTVEDEKASVWARRRASIARGMLGGEAGRRAVVKGRDYSAGGTGWAEKEKMDGERSARATRGNRLGQIKDSLGEGPNADPTKIGDLSKDQLLEMMQDPNDRKLVMNNAHLLKPDQVKSIMESDKLNDGVKGQLASTQKDKMLAALDSPDGAKQIFNQYKKDITKLPASVLTNEKFAEHLMDTSILSKLATVEGLSPAERKAIKANVLSKTTDQNATTFADWFDHDRLGKHFKA